LKCRHLLQADRDRLRLAALLRVDSRIGARGVDERDHRPAEALGELHQAERLAVPLRPRHPEAAQDVLLGGPALLLADHHHRFTVEARQPADQRLVVAEGPVAVQLEPIGEQPLDIVEHVRAVGVAGELDHLPARELVEDLLLEPRAPLLQPADLAVQGVDAPGTGSGRGVPLELRELRLQLQERLFEIECVGGHRSFHAGAPSYHRIATRKSRTASKASRTWLAVEAA
jgi:hypothetical protein